MENLTGLLRIRVRRGCDLPVRDSNSSDPYVLITMGEQKIKTRSVRNSCDPEWNDELTLAVSDPDIPVQLVTIRPTSPPIRHGSPRSVGRMFSNNASDSDPAAAPELIPLSALQAVFDEDTFTGDDKMGEADVPIKAYMECVKSGTESQPPGTVVRKVHPNIENGLAEVSRIYWNEHGRLVQDMLLKLKNVVIGQVEIQIEWIELPPARSTTARC